MIFRGENGNRDMFFPLMFSLNHAFSFLSSSERSVCVGGGAGVGGGGRESIPNFVKFPSLLVCSPLSVPAWRSWAQCRQWLRDGNADSRLSIWIMASLLSSGFGTFFNLSVSVSSSANKENNSPYILQLCWNKFLGPRRGHSCPRCPISKPKLRVVLCLCKWFCLTKTSIFS